MFLIVPLACYVILFLVLSGLAPAMPWRSTVLWTSVIWGVILTFITEALSLLQSLTFLGVLLSWCIALALIVAVGALRLRRIAANDKRAGSGGFAGISLRLRGSLARRDLSSIPIPLSAAFVAMLIIIAVIALIGIVAPPNNWDSMTYHMARTIYWMEHAQVTPYPTDIMRQLYETPWAEFCITHFYLLSGGDRFSAAVQWLALVGSLIGVSLIAEQLGAGRRGQIAAVIFAGTLPMGILQASSTQNDLVVTFWMVCLVHFLLAFRERPTVWNSLGIGVSLGLAMLSKATAYVYALPFLLLFMIWAWRSLRWRLWEAASVVGSVAIAINIGYYLRDILAFNALFGPPSEVSHYSNEHFTPATLISNVLRDLAVQMGTPSHKVNMAIDHGLRAIFTALHLDINDPATTWGPYQFNALSYHEDYAGNPLHLLIIAGILILCLAVARLRADRLLWTYIAAIVGVFLVFAMYLKWQPWHSRLELVMFVLFAPVCGVVLSRISPRFGLNFVAVVLTLAAIPWVLHNQSRPLIGSHNIFNTPRAVQYFANRPAYAAPYLAAAQSLRQSGCTTIGLIDGIDDWEYPLWALVNDGTRRVEFEHVLVHNETAPLADVEPYASFQPCAIVVIKYKQGAMVSYHGVDYYQTWSSDVVTIYLRR